MREHVLSFLNCIFSLQCIKKTALNDERMMPVKVSYKDPLYKLFSAWMHARIYWIKPEWKYNFKGLTDLQKRSWWPSNRNRMFSACVWGWALACVSVCVCVCFKCTLHLNGGEKKHNNWRSWLTAYEILVRQCFLWMRCAAFCHFVYLTWFGWVQLFTLC